MENPNPFIELSPNKLILHRKPAKKKGYWYYWVTDKDGNEIRLNRVSAREYVACSVIDNGGTFPASWCGRVELLTKGDSGKKIKDKRFYGIAIREDFLPEYYLKIMNKNKRG